MSGKKNGAHAEDTARSRPARALERAAASCLALFAEAGAVCRCHRRGLLALMAAIVGGAAALFPHDAALLETVIGWSNTALRGWLQDIGAGLGWSGLAELRRQDLKEAARALYFWGDFLTGSLIFSAVVWLVGRLAGWRLWRVAALAALLASAVAGLTANFLRLTTGRPRPLYERIADGFYGVRFDHRYHAFPSGHSATAWGTATALAVAAPAVGVPALAGAGAVVWSRLYLKAHRPADVWVGAGFGVFWGVALGLAARRVTRADASAGGCGGGRADSDMGGTDAGRG